MGATVRLANSFKNTPPAFITDNCVTGWTLEPMDTCDWEESPTIKAELNWLQLPLSPFCLSLCPSGPASASSMDILTPRFCVRTDGGARSISPRSHGYLLHFLKLVPGWRAKLSCQMAAHPSLCWWCNLREEVTNRKRGRVLRSCHFSFKRQLHWTKAY